MAFGRTLLSGTAPQSRTAFGTVPSGIPTPPNVFSQLSGAVPNFGALTSGTSNIIGSQQAGTVSPGTMNAIKTASAQFGVASGMPGSGLEQNQLFGNIAGFSEAQQQKGLQNYLALISGVGPTMTNPKLAAEISARNADFAAAPDPRLAHDQQIADYERALSTSYALANPSRGPWWAPGGINTPPITTHSNWGGTGLTPPGVFSTPDAFGYNMPATEWGPAPTPVYGAINPQEPYYNPNAYSQWAANYGHLYPGLTEGGGNPGESEYVPDYPGQ